MHALPPIANLLIEIQADIQQAANERAERFRPAPDKPPVLDLEVLCDLLMKSAETAEICWTEKSRENRKRALIQAGSLALLALFEMRRGEVSDRSDTLARKQQEDLRAQLDAAKELLAAAQPIVEAAEALTDAWNGYLNVGNTALIEDICRATTAFRANCPHVSDRSDTPEAIE